MTYTVQCRHMQGMWQWDMQSSLMQPVKRTDATIAGRIAAAFAHPDLNRSPKYQMGEESFCGTGGD